MLSSDTLQSAHSWYETGVRRVLGEQLGIGVNYLERAIPIFAEAGELRALTRARHYKLLALLLDERYDEAEALFADIQQGYTELGESYGQALLLCHFAQAQAAQGRWQRAHSLFNLAAVVAENDQHGAVLTYVLWQQGQLCRSRDDLVRAVAVFQRAEKLVEHEHPPERLAQFRFQRAQALSLLGETAEAIALLEDVQAHYLRHQQNQAAMEPLTLLRRLYEDQGLTDERNRVARLMHLGGQRMIQVDAIPKPKAHLGPPIDPEL